MNDPDVHDTEPMARAAGSGPDADRRGDARTTPGDARLEPREPGPPDTDDFLRWLPTMWLGHRRRAELVQRPSSDGADFAAYACEGRPAPASTRVVLGERAQGSRGADRDAPTVVIRRRSGLGARLGGGALGLVAAAAAIGAWPHRRAEPPSPSPDVRACASAAPAVAGAPFLDVASSGDLADAQTTHRLSPAAPPRVSPRRPLAKDAALARGAAAAAPRPPGAAKDQYFEAQ